VLVGRTFSSGEESPRPMPGGLSMPGHGASRENEAQVSASIEAPHEAATQSNHTRMGCKEFEALSRDTLVVHDGLSCARVRVPHSFSQIV